VRPWTVRAAHGDHATRRIGDATGAPGQAQPGSEVLNMRSRQPATVRVARWSATHPWRAIGLWVLLVALCVVAGGATGTRQATDRELAIGEAGRADAIQAEGSFDDPAEERVLITARSGALDRAAAARAAADVAGRLRQLPEVAEVSDPVQAPDGTALLVPVVMRGDPGSADRRVGPLLAATAAVQDANPGLRVEQVGDASIDHGIGERLDGDLDKAFRISLPLTLLILLVAFGAIVGASVPVLLAVSAVVAAMGLWGPASQLVPGVDAVPHLIVLIGMAVGVDYSLFYLKREREERAHGRGHVDAVEIAAATSGRSVVVSGVAVIVALAGLYMAGDVTFSALATGAVLVVAVAVLGSLTILPALLVRLRGAVDRPRVPLLWRLTSRRGRPRLWPALLRPALRRPGLALALAVAALAALALPALGMDLRPSGPDTLPRSIPVVGAYDRLTAAFPSTGSRHLVAVRAPAGRAGQVRAALEDLAARTGRDPLFAHDRAPEIRASADRRIHTLQVASPSDFDSPQALAALERLRGTLVPATVGGVDGAEHAVGGEVAGGVDAEDKLSGALPLVVGFVLALTFLVMSATFRSVVIGLTAIAINLLSTLAAFGLLVLVFQHRWAEDLLGFSSTGSVTVWVPMFLFVILFGLSMDYHVFVVSRIREAAGRGLPIRRAVAEGIVGSAGTVTSAAVVMVAVFSIFATLSMVEMKQLGVGLGAAVLIDALVVRVVVLPSLMALLGRANWWPSRLSRPVTRQPEPASDTQPPEAAPVP
jgi:RND superfamily putative drug exporter